MAWAALLGNPNIPLQYDSSSEISMIPRRGVLSEELAGRIKGSGIVRDKEVEPIVDSIASLSLNDAPSR